MRRQVNALRRSDDVEEANELAQRLVQVFERFAQLARQYHRPHPLIGRLPVNHVQALHLLAHEPGIAQKDLAERLRITPAAVSNAVRDMESAGLIERRPDTADARLMRLFLSAESEAFIRESQASRCMMMAEFLSALPLAEQRLVVEALERAVQAKQTEWQRASGWGETDSQSAS